MYFIAVILLMLLLPAGCVLIEAIARHGDAALIDLVGKWFTFWGVGVRLFLAGVMQVAYPQFTAQSIFAIRDPTAYGLVREIGFGNLAMSALGIASLFDAQWTVPAAIVGGIYYGLAGVGHIGRHERNAKEQMALASDLLIFLLLAAFVVSSAGSG